MAKAPEPHPSASPIDVAISEVATNATVLPEPSGVAASTPPTSDAPISAEVTSRLLLPQVPQTLQDVVDKNTNVQRLIFTVPESKLESKSRFTISQPFQIPIPGGSIPCKIKVSAKEMYTKKFG